MPKKRVLNPLQTHWRSSDFLDPFADQPNITIVGAGGIGSWVAPQLAKLGIRNLVVYDMDRVVAHNIGTSPYQASDIGKRKVVALGPIVRQFGASVHYTGVPRRFDGQKLPPTDILISAVDSMGARRILYKAAVAQKIPYFIDGRIGGEDLRVYAIRIKRPEDRRLYQSTLVADRLVAPLPCTRQQVGDISWLIAGLIGRAVRQLTVDGHTNPEIVIQGDTLDVMIMPKRTQTFRTRAARKERMLNASDARPLVREDIEGSVAGVHSRTVDRTADGVLGQTA